MVSYNLYFRDGVVIKRINTVCFGGLLFGSLIVNHHPASEAHRIRHSKGKLLKRNLMSAISEDPDIIPTRLEILYPSANMWKDSAENNPNKLFYDQATRYLRAVVRKMPYIQNKNMDTLLEDGVSISTRAPGRNFAIAASFARNVTEWPGLVTKWARLVDGGVSEDIALILCHLSMSKKTCLKHSGFKCVKYGPKFIMTCTGHSPMAGSISVGAVLAFLKNKKVPIDRTVAPFMRNKSYVNMTGYWKHIGKDYTLKNILLTEFISPSELPNQHNYDAIENYLYMEAKIRNAA